MTYSNANFTPSLKGYSNVKPFRFWCQKVLPLVYDDSLSYYELLCKVVDYLNNVISDLSATEDNVGELLDAYNQLQDYVNNYFTNLNVQEEINNKLDAMFADGTIPTMIEEYVHPFIVELNENYAELDSQINETMDTQNANIETLTSRVNNLVINNTTNLTGYNVVTVESTTAQGGITITENIPKDAEILQVCYSGYNDTNNTIKSSNISYVSTPNAPTSTQQQVVVTITDSTDTRFNVFITYAVSQSIEIAELTDIRVGNGGTTYSSAGNAVRGQTSDLNRKIDKIKENVGGIYSITDLGSWQAGGLSRGEYDATIYYRLATPMPVYIENSLTISVETGRRAVVHTVTSSGEFISDSGWIAGGSSYTIPSNTYVRMMLSPTSTTSEAELEYHATIEEYASFATYTIESPYLTEESLLPLENELYVLVNGVTITWNDGYALANNGAAVAVSGYSASDFIELNDTVLNSTFHNLRQKISYTIVPICFYDDAKTFIGYYTDASLGNDASLDIKISDIISNYPGAEFIKIGKSDIDNVTVDVLTLESLNNRVTVMKNNIDNVYPSYKYNMFSKVLFIGDSVTAGFVVEGTQENPQTIYTTLPEYSYPVQFNKIHDQLNMTVKARTGYCVHDWYDEFYNSTDFSEYDLIIIELGYNAGNYGYLNMTNLETEGTNAYLYNTMVGQIRTQNSNAEIVLVRSSWKINTVNWIPVLNTIASDHDCKVIDLTDTKYLNLDAPQYHGYYNNNGTPAIDYAHFTRKGYNAKAYVVSRLIAELLD